MDRFQDRAMCFIPPNKTNQNNFNNDFNLNIEIKQEIPDIDFEEEKIEDTTTYDDGYHSKCGEIYISNINKEFSFYCSLCNANFINFNLFSRHILYGNHGTQLSFLNKNNNNNNSSNQISQFYRGRDSKSDNKNSIQQPKINDIQTLPSILSYNSRNFLNIDNKRSNRDFREPIDYKSDNVESLKNDIELTKCRACLKIFQSNRDLKAHIQICHTDRRVNLPKQSQIEKKSNLDNVVSVATFSLAVCSTPTGKNETNIGKSGNLRESKEVGKVKNACETIRVKSFSNLKQETDPLSISSSSFPSTNHIKQAPRYASKTTTPIIFSKTKCIYPTSNKYTGSAITHDTQKVSIIKASATIAEIANNENTEEVCSSSISDQMSGNCPYCPVKFQKMKYINFHIQKYHPEKIQENEIKIKESENCYQCEMCNKLFRRLDFYKKHMRKHPRNKHKFLGKKISEPSKIEDIQNDKNVKETVGTAGEKNVSEYNNQNPIKSNSDTLDTSNIIEKTNTVMDQTKAKSGSRRRLKCQYCGKTVLKLNHLILHERKHKANSSVKCRVCEERYCFKAAYDNHMKHVHPGVEYNLNDDEIKILSWPKHSGSSLNSPNSNNLILPEEEAETSINKKSCSFCPKVFKTVEYRILHEKAHTGTGNFACKYCDEKFDSIGILWSHQRNCSKKFDEISSPSQYWRTFENQLFTAQTENDLPEEPDLLEQHNGTKSALLGTEIPKTDSENIGIKSRFKCTYCKKLFTRKSNWIHHVRKHTGEKFECNICDYKTTSPFFLKSHIMKIHDYSKASKNIAQEADTASTANPNTAVEAATKTSLLKSKLLLQSLAKFDSITSEEKTESFIRLKLFKCKFCNKVYTKKNNLEEHLKVHLKSKQISCFDLYKCKYCNLRYKVKYQALLHKRKHRKEKVVKCNLCAKSFNKYFISCHKKIQHNINIRPSIKPTLFVKCQVCNKEFKLMKDLKAHEKDMHENQKTEFECKICKKKFDLMDTLKMHLTSEHKKPENTEESGCSKVPVLLTLEGVEPMKTLPEQSNDSEVVEGNWTKKEKCKICGEIFDYHCLATHVRTHTIDNKPHKCENCPRAFRFKSSLVRHSMTVHSKKKQQKKIDLAKSSARVLNKETFSSPLITSTPAKKSKKITIRTLIKDKKIPVVNGPPFKCPHEDCRKFFGRRLGFNKHYLLHLDTFKCKYCNRCFQTRKVLLKHINFHTEKLPYKCKICSKAFPVKHALIWHKRRNNCENPLAEESKISYNCERCLKSFITKSTLSKHILENKCEFVNSENKTSTELTQLQTLSSFKEEEASEVETKLKCDTCGQGFLDSSNLSTHYKKTNCVPKAFALQASNLKNDKELTTINLPIGNPEITSETFTKNKCELCSKIFDTKIALSWHKRRRVCEVPSDFLCEYKTDDFASINLPINNSQITQDISLKSKCELCSKIFDSKIALSWHKRRRVCEVPSDFLCEYKVEEVAAINLPTENSTGTQDVSPKSKCELCLKIFDTKMALSWHKRRRVCEVPSDFLCEYKTDELATINFPINNSEITQEIPPKGKCELCFKTFDTKIALSWHKRRRVCEVPSDFLCEYKVEEFAANKLSIENFETVQDISPKSKCELCLKMFDTKIALSWHKRRRVCEVPSDFLCECKTDELATINLTANNSEIMQEIPAKSKCELCFKIFDTKIALSWHKRRRVCEVPSDFLCEYKADEYKETENYSFPVNKDEKVEDIKKINLEKDNKNEEALVETAAEVKKEHYQCEVCLKIFVVKGFLLRHMKYYHPPLIEKNIEEIKNETADRNENEIENGIESEENSNRRSTRKKVENESAKFQCQICLKKFETKGLLAGHTRTKACFKSSSCMSTLRAQKNPIKDGVDAVNKCNLCNKVFANEGFLTFHVKHQICVLKKDQIPIQPDLQNSTIETLSDKSDNPTNEILKEDTESGAVHELKINKVPENPLVYPTHRENLFFTCKRCSKKFSTKVELAWHTRRRECFYKRKKYKLKTGLSINQQASKIRKKLIDGIVSSRKVRTERKILQKKIYKAAIQVYKKNKSVADMANKYQISKTIIYKRVNAFKEMNVSLTNLKKTDLLNKIENTTISEINAEKPTIEKENENAATSVEPEVGLVGMDINKVLPKIDLTVLRNEKDKNMVRAIRNYVRDRKKGRKLPQRFYCDRYQIRKIHFYRKLFKLGLVRKKGPQKRDSDNIPLTPDAAPSLVSFKCEVENQKPTNQCPFPMASLTTSSILNVSEQAHRGKRGRLPKCSEETVRKAVMEYKMGKGTQLQLCEKYNVGICAFHRVKKLLQNELPNSEFPSELKEEVRDLKTNENFAEQSKLVDNSIPSISKILDVNIKENISDSKEESTLTPQIYNKFKIDKTKRKIKMMKTGDLKKRRLAVMEACGDLIVNRKSKYNMPGTKENLMLMDAIGDVVHGIRSFSNAVKHYKISFYTLQRYLDKYNERMKNKKRTVTFQDDTNFEKTTSIDNENTVNCSDENKSENVTENVSEDLLFKKENSLSSPSSSSSSTISTSSHSTTESDSSDSTESDSDTSTTSENMDNMDIKKTDESINTDASQNVPNNLKPQQKVVFDPTTGQYIVKKKYEGRGGKGKVRQTVYSKPGTKENAVLMAAINEIRTKGESIGYVAKKFQISIQTVNKYINLFEKQGIIPKFSGPRADEVQLGSNYINSTKNSDSEPKIVEKCNVDIETQPKIIENPPQVNTTLVENTPNEEIKVTDNNNSAIIFKSQEEYPIMEKNEFNQNVSVVQSKYSFLTAIGGNQTNFDFSVPKNIALDLSGGSKIEEEKQNVLKENSISSIKKDVENIKDFIRKPIFITQKMSSTQNTTIDCTKNKTMAIGLIAKQTENVQKDNRLIKSTIEIRKPTYLTQRSSAAVVKFPDVKPPSLAESNLTNSVISKISDLNKCPVITKNITVSDHNQIIYNTLTHNPFISQTLKPTETAQKSHFAFIDKSSFSCDMPQINQNIIENEKPKEIQLLPKNLSGNQSEKIIAAITVSTEAIKKEKNVVQSEQHQNIKIRKPTYITQKSSCPPIKNIAEIGQQSDKQNTVIQSVQKPPEQIIQISSTTTSHLLSQKIHPLNFNEKKLDRSSSLATSTSSIIRSQNNNLKIDSRDQTITGFLSNNPKVINIQPEEDDFIIEHAMRSLLEQDTELDADSTTVANKNEIAKISYDTAASSDGNSDSTVLKTSTNTLTPTYNTLNDSSNFNKEHFFNAKDSNFQSS